MGEEPSYSVVQASRGLYIFSELKNYFPLTYLIMKQGARQEVVLDKLVEVKPFIPIKGKFTLLKGIIFRFQFSIYSLKFIISNKLNYVILRGYDPILLLPVLKLFNVYVYYDFHGLYYLELIQQKRYLRAFFVKHIQKIFLANCDKIIVVSEGIRSQIKEYHNKCIKLPNGVDLNKINAGHKCAIQLPADKRIIGFIGNWERVMKIEDICDSVAYLDNTMALIIGRGYRFEEIVQKYEGKSNVMFTDRIQQEDVYTLLKKMDVCIVPYNKGSYMSRIKNFFSSRKIPEYLAAGKPIIISDIEGVDDFLIEGVNYLKYKSGDPESLADKVNLLFHDLNLFNDLCENNRELSMKLSWPRLIKDSGIVADIQNIGK